MPDALDQAFADLETLQAEQAQVGPPPPPKPGSPARPPFLGPTSAQTKQAPSAAQAKPAPKGPEGGVLTKAKDALVNFGKFTQEVSGLGGVDPKKTSDARKAIAVGVVRSPAVLLGGTLDTFADQGKLIGDSINADFARKHPLKALNAAALAVSPLGPVSQSLSILRQNAPTTRGGASFSDVLSDRKGLGQIGRPDVNQGSAQVAANIEGFALSPLRAAKAPKLGAYGLGLRDAISHYIQSAATQGVIAGASADTDTRGETSLNERAKVAAVGAAVTVVAEPLMGLLGSAIKSRLRGAIKEATPEEALHDTLDRDFAAGRSQEARYQQQDALAGANADPVNRGASADPGVSDGSAVVDASGVRVTGDGAETPAGQPVDGKPSGSPGRPAPGGTPEVAPTGEIPPERTADLVPEEAHPYKDAQAALDKVGAQEVISPETHPVRPDGRIPVTPATKQLLDNAGVGRSFAAADEGLPDTVLFKEADDAGGQRVVAQWDRADLESFQNDAEGYLYGDKDGGLVGADPNAQHAAGQWKVGNLAASYDAPAYIRAAADRLPKRAVTTDAEVMAAAKAQADAIGWDPEDMLAYATSVSASMEDIVPTMATMRTILARAGSSMESTWDTIGSNLDDLADGSPELAQLQRDMATVMGITQDVAEFKSGVGGALRVGGLPDADTWMANFGKVPEGHLTPIDPLEGLPKLPRTKAELKAWMDAWNYTKDNPKARAAFLEGLTFMRPKWYYVRNSFANFFTASIISAPSTILRNFVGPSTISLVRAMSRTGGAYTAALRPGISQAERDALLAVGQSTFRAYAETFGHMGDAFEAARKALVTGKNIVDPGSELYSMRSEPIPQGIQDMMLAKDPGLTGPVAYKIANAVNLFPSFVHRLHGTTNEFAQRLAYLGEVRATAYVEAAEKGLKGQNLTDYVAKRLKDSTDEVTFAGLDQRALQESRRTNFIQSVGAEGSETQKWAKRVNEARANIPELRYVLPIFSVPANAIGESMRYIPVVGQLFKETQEELAGRAGAVLQAEAYGRAMAGAAFLGTGFMMAQQGLLTGAGPQDAGDRKLWLQQGYQPYSVKIGGHWVSYNKLDLVGPLLAVPAMIHDKSVHSQADKGNMALVGVGALAQYFKDQAALQGLSDLLSFGDDPDQAEGLLKKFANQTARGFVPNFIQQMGRNNVDPMARTVRNPWEAVLNSLPGASSQLDPQRNLLGEPTEKVLNVGFNVFPLSMSQMNTYAKDPVTDEMSRLYEVTGYAPGVKGTALPGGNVDMRDIKLEGGNSLYDALLGARATATNEDGQTLRGALSDLINSQEYDEAVDADGSNLETSTGETSRGALIQRTILAFDKDAQQQVAQQSPIAARYLAAAALKRADDAALRDVPIEDIVKNPTQLGDLQEALGLFEEKVKGQ